MHQSSTEPIILNYKRRRYDGGPEMELIAYLEAQHKQLELTETGNMANLLEDIMDGQLDNAPRSRWHQLGEVVCIGPLEITVGILGMLTTGLAAMVFKAFMNPALSEQSRSVFHDCWDTFKQGCKHTVYAPVNVVKVLRTA
jgi:hypothetical protein